MKKLIAMLLALVMVLALAACAPANEDGESTPAADETTGDTTGAPEADTTGSEEADVMSYAEYVAAELETEVVIEAYVQATQGWWFDAEAGHGKITVYTQDADGAYFLYELTCAEEDADKLTEGTKIRVTGYKAEWSGEVEITEATFVFVEDADTYVAEALDITDIMASDDLIDYQNQKIAVKGASIESIEYKNGEPGDDIYVTVGVDGASYDFCVEVYLTGTDSEVYTTVGELAVGDVVDIEGFLYWYEGPNAHITAIAVAE